MELARPDRETVRDVTRSVRSVPLDRRGVVWGIVEVAVTLAISFVGSDGLVWFDAALVGYLFGVVFMVFGVIYRYTVWVRRPPTAMLNRRGWDAFRRRRGHNLAALPSLVATHLLAQGFIRRRSPPAGSPAMTSPSSTGWHRSWREWYCSRGRRPRSGSR